MYKITLCNKIYNHSLVLLYILSKPLTEHVILTITAQIKLAHVQNHWIISVVNPQTKSNQSTEIKLNRKLTQIQLTTTQYYRNWNDQQSS